MMKKTITAACLVLTAVFSASAQQGDHFVFSQLIYRGGNWDPCPSSFSEIINVLTVTTSVKAERRRNDVAPTDVRLFSSPFLYMTGNSAFEPFTNEETGILRQWMLNGGLLVIDDTAGQKNFGFDRSARDMVKRLFPDRQLEKVPTDSAVYKSFYLMRGVGGRKIVNQYLECIFLEGRIALVYSQNDLTGAWARDRLGNWIYECIPGGETQRMEAMKLTINIIMYSLTGTYKEDSVHQPYIRRKLRYRE